MKHKSILSLLLLLLLATSPPATTAQEKDVKPQLGEQLWEAARVGDAAQVRALLDKGADVNAKFRYNQTPLFKAAERGHTEVVRLLLERGADVNLRDTFYGATPLRWALDKGHTGVVRALLEKGAEEVDDVLMKGVREVKTELIEAALTTKRATPETLTAALAVASNRRENPEIIGVLKQAGAAPPPVIDAATLQAYTGKYRNEAGTMNVDVTLKDGKFIAQATGQPSIVLIALDKTTFRPVDFDGLAFVFITEGSRVTGFTLKQGPTPTLFKRIEETKQQ